MRSQALGMALFFLGLSGCNSNLNIPCQNCSPNVQVTGVSPASGTVIGGNLVTISGTQFHSGITQVKLGGTGCTSLQVVSATELTCVAGTHRPSSIVNIDVYDALGNQFSLAQGYTYSNLMIFTDYSGRTVSILAINPATGELTAVPGSPFATVARPQSAILDKSGKYLYVGGTNNPGTSELIATYSIDGNGLLTPTAQQTLVLPAGQGSQPRFFVLHPSGKFLYVSDDGGPIWDLSVDSQTGALGVITNPPVFPPGGSPWLIHMDPAGTAVYLDAGSSFASLSINPTSGALTNVSFRATSLSNGDTGRLLPDASYILSMGNPSVNHYDVTSIKVTNATGVLSAVGGSPFAASTLGSAATGFILDQLGQYAFAGVDTSTDVFSISSGVLNQITVLPLRPELVTPDNRYLITSGINSASVYRMGTFSLAQNYPSFLGPYPISFDPTGNFMYALDSTGNFFYFYQYDSQTGGLTLNGHFADPVNFFGFDSYNPIFLY